MGKVDAEDFFFLNATDFVSSSVCKKAEIEVTVSFLTRIEKWDS